MYPSAVYVLDATISRVVLIDGFFMTLVTSSESRAARSAAFTSGQSQRHDVIVTVGDG